MTTERQIATSQTIPEMIRSCPTLSQAPWETGVEEVAQLHSCLPAPSFSEFLRTVKSNELLFKYLNINRAHGCHKENLQVPLI